LHGSHTLRELVSACFPTSLNAKSGLMVTIADNALRCWNECIAESSVKPGSRGTLKLLAEGCRSLLPADAIFAAVYSKDLRPVQVYEDVPKAIRHEVIDSYLKVAYLLDPFYRAGIEGLPGGLYRLTDIGPPGFRNSEFYRVYYHQSGISDEIGFLTYLHDDCFMNFSLVRLEGSSDFEQKGIETLRLFEPVVHQHLISFWKAQSAATRSASSELHAQLEVALSRFGNSVLTGREAEVIRMYLKGHSTASITERLGISYHTVSTHRKSAYLKLDIGSQGELFHLFIDSLSCFDPVKQRDPLRAYLSVVK